MPGGSGGRAPRRVLAQLTTSNRDDPLNAVRAGTPNEIHSLRRVYKVHPDDAFFEGSDAKAINANLKTFSLVHVLVYKFKTGPTFADLPNIPWNQTYKEMFVDESIKA